LTVNPAALLQQGMTEHRAGRLAQAIAAYRQVLTVAPNHADTHHLLGLALSHNEQEAESLAHFRRACELAPAHAVLWFRLGCAEQMAGDGEAAKAAYRRALAADPEHGETRINLSGLLSEPAQAAEALALLTPLLAGADVPLAARLNAARALRRLGQYAEAAEHARAVLVLDAHSREGAHELAQALEGLGQIADAVAILEPVVRGAGAWPEGLYDLARLYQACGRFTDAVQAYRQVVVLRPDLMAPRNNLGGALREIGELAEALQAFEQAVQRYPTYAPTRSNVLLTLHYANLPDSKLLAQRHVDEVAALGLHAGPRRSARADGPLTIAYLSPDLRAHSVGWFAAPVIAAHDRNQVRVIAYSDGRRDAHSTAIAATCTLWRDTGGMSDAALAATIADDHVDVLIDLAGHTAGNRLPLLAQRVAPIQLTWLGYPDITGLPTIDGRLTDAIADPPGTDTGIGEALLRIPGGFLAYAPPQHAPAAARVPFAGQAGRVVFGSFNHLAKVGPETLTLWARILAALPQARLVVKAIGLADAGARAGFLARAVAAGLPAARLDILSPTPDVAGHLAAYGGVDIALDTIPYNGTTTTCEALWMGVPVLTVVGNAHVARVGASLLTAAGLPDLVAEDADAYVALAVAVANDPARLAGLHATLRARLTASPLGDARRVAAYIESVARTLVADLVEAVP
jgi:protein O-GlcNAc transferase